MVAWKFDNGTPNNGDIQEAIADFEDKHPGLVDLTATCERCNSPYDPESQAGYLCPACVKEAR